MIIQINRWLVDCRLCKQRFTQEGRIPPTEHDCPALGTDAKSRPSEVKRIIHRTPKSGKEHCRMAEPRHIPAFKDKPGECGWACKGSLSPNCYCEGCHGFLHGITGLKEGPSEPGAGANLIDELRRRTPDREIARKGRKST